MVQAKSGAARAPSDILLTSTASGGTRDNNSPPEKQTRNALKRNKHFEPGENIPLSTITLGSRNKDGKDTDIRMSDDCNALPFNQRAQPAWKREECETHVYINQPAQPARKREECETHVYTNQQIIQRPDNTYTHLSNALRDDHIYGQK